MMVHQAMASLTVRGPSVVPTWATAENFLPGETKIISLNTMNDVWEGPQPAGGGTLIKAVGGYNGGVDAPKLGISGSKIFAGGGDADYWGTEAYAFSFSTQLWARIKNRTTALSWNGGVDQAREIGDPLRFDIVRCEHGDGTPGAPHTYDTLCLDPEVGPSGALLRTVSRFIYTTASTNYAHRLVLGHSNVYSAWESASVDASSVNASTIPMTDYDPTTKRAWSLGGSSGGVWMSGLCYLDTVTGANGVIHAPGEGSILIRYGCMRFWRGPDNDRRLLIWFVDGLPQIFDLDNLDQLYTPTLTGTLPLGDNLAWAGPHGCFFVKPVTPANQMYKVTPPANPLTGVWTSAAVTLTGVAAGGDMWKRFDYAAALDLLTWYYFADGPVYAHRPAVA